MLTIEVPRVAMDQPAQGSIVADRRLYLTEDRETIVEPGDEKAAWLFCATGHSIPGSEVTRLALVVDAGKVVQRRTVVADDTEGIQRALDDASKQRTPDENKMRGAGETKEKTK
jgi:hypothetical protein